MEKFKVGDTVRVKYLSNMRLFILEVHEQICNAGVAQTWYLGRQFSIGRYGGIAKDYTKFSSIELESIPSMSAELQTTIAGLKKVGADKAKFVKDEMFDKAAALREKEALLRHDAERLAEKEGFDIADII